MVLMSFVCLAFPLRILLEYILYKKIVKRKYPLFTTANILDLSVSGLQIGAIILNDTYDRFANIVDQLVKHRGDPYYHGKVFVYLVLYGMTVAFLCFRFILLLKIFSFLGPLIKTFIEMIGITLRYMFIWFALILSFASIAHITLFNDHPELRTLFLTFSTMLNFIYGDYEPSIFTDTTFGSIFVSIFMMITYVIGLNFCIALITQAYSDIYELRYYHYN